MKVALVVAESGSISATQAQLQPVVTLGSLTIPAQGKTPAVTLAVLQV